MAGGGTLSSSGLYQAPGEAITSATLSPRRIDSNNRYRSVPGQPQWVRIDERILGHKWQVDRFEFSAVIAAPGLRGLTGSTVLFTSATGTP